MNKVQIKGLILFFTFIVCSIPVFASDYYWVGGSGNWSDYGNHWATSSGGVLFHTTIPAPTDDVYFDVNSFLTSNDTVYLDATLVYCKNMNWSGALHNPVIKSTIINNDLKISGSLVLIPAMKNLIQYVSFESAVSGNTITSSGQFFPGQVTFNGTGSWMLLDGIGAWTIDLYRGTLITNNQPVNCSEFQSIFNNVINLQLGSSNIHVDYWMITATTLVLNATNSTIIAGSDFSGGSNYSYGNVTSKNVYSTNCTFNDVSLNYPGHLSSKGSVFNHVNFNDEGKINGAGNTFHSVVFMENGSITDTNTFDTLIFMKSGCIINLKKTQTINDFFSANGSCAGLTVIQSENPGVKAGIKKASGSVVLDHVLLQDIKGIGGASFIANNSINNGNVSGFTINSPMPQNLYWVGGTGSWSDIGHWAVSSGGAGGTCVPGPFDNVFFDSNSFLTANDTVYQDGAIDYCYSMDWTGAINNPVFQYQATNSILKIYGSLTLTAGVNFNLYYLKFESDNPGNTITSAGCQINAQIYFEGNGSWQLADSVHTGIINLVHGSLYTNDQLVVCSSINGNSDIASGLYLGSSIVKSGSWGFNSGIMNLDADSSVIITSYFYSGSNQAYHDVTAYLLNCDSNTFHHVVIQNNGSLGNAPGIFGDHAVFDQVVMNDYAIINGSGNLFHEISFLNGGEIKDTNAFDTLQFINPGVLIRLYGIQTINYLFSANGSCQNLTTIESLIPGNQAIIYKNTGAVVADYIVMKDIIATGGATFIAGNSINLGNVSGWTINPPANQNFYWVGGSGNWSDHTHWASSSGGLSGNCIPGPLDSVFFDSNSFSTINDTVYQNMPLAYCNNMDWTTATNDPVIKYTSVDNSIKIFGSLHFCSGMNNQMRNITFASNTTGNTIASAGQKLNGTTTFEGTGGYMFTDSVHAWDINLDKGTLKTNSANIDCHYIYISNFNSYLYLDSSVIYCSKWNSGYGQLFITGPSSTIVCPDFTSGQGQVFGDVYGSINASGTTFHDIQTGSLSASNSAIHDVVFLGTSYLNCSGSTFEKAVFTGDAMIFGDNVFDTLIFDNAGGEISIRDNQTVNSAFWTNASPGFPISIGNVNPVFYPTLIVPSGVTVCLDYIYMQNMAATGGATFYAGDHSTDLGNNSGWIWSSCTPDTSNVWPGDANYDLVADNIDLLYIGLAYAYIGPVRVGATTNWVAQPGIDWLQQFATGYNIKHADCDGNGTINAVDTNAVSLNYGLVHPFKNPTPPLLNNFGTDLYFDVPPTSLTPGADVDIPIMFGTVANAASNVYGIAFTVNYDPAFIQANTAEITFNNSWCGNAGNTIHLSRDFYNSGMVDMALVKTDHQNETGSGQLATLHFKVASNASGYLNLSFSKIIVMDKFEITQPVNAINTSVFTGSQDNITSSHFSVSPNPANDFVFIGNSIHSIKAIHFIDVTGKKYEMPVTDHLNTSKLPSSVYELEMLTAEGIYRKKMVIIH